MDRASFSRGVLLKGLPFSTSKENIKQFFRNFAIPHENITFILFRNAKQTGVAFVKLTNEEVQRALLMDRNHMGDRYIEVVASDEVEMYDLVVRAREGTTDAREINRLVGKGSKKGGLRDRSPVRKQLSTKCAYISGIPAGYTYRQVREFFKGRLIAHNCIYLLQCDGSNVFRGDGYVEFGNEEECFKGLKKNGNMMGGAIIQVVPCSKEEMDEVVHLADKRFAGKRDLRATIRKNQAAHPRKGHGTSRGRTPSPVRRRMKAYAATYGRQELEDERYAEFHGINTRYTDPRIDMPYSVDPSILHSRGTHSEMKSVNLPPTDIFKPEEHRRLLPPNAHSGNPFHEPRNESLTGYGGHIERNSFPEHEFTAPLPPGPTHEPRGLYGGGKYPQGDEKYHPGGAKYPPGGDKYPQGDDKYHPGGGKYPQGDDKYHPGGGKYPPGGEKYHPGGGKYPPGGEKYHPGGGKYPPGGEKYHPGSEKYPPVGEKYPPGGGKYPPGSGKYPSMAVHDIVPSHQHPHPPVNNLPPYSPPKSVERRIIRLEGLPYEVNVRDIIEFFHGFHVEYEHVRIQCREDGSPSGKAFVTFPSEKHARSAVQNNNRQYILDRYVELILV